MLNRTYNWGDSNKGSIFKFVGYTLIFLKGIWILMKGIKSKCEEQSIKTWVKTESILPIYCSSVLLPV